MGLKRAGCDSATNTILEIDYTRVLDWSQYVLGESLKIIATINIQSPACVPGFLLLLCWTQNPAWLGARVLHGLSQGRRGTADFRPRRIMKPGTCSTPLLVT